ncbi:MAG: hypothetical protein KA293_10720 [Bacteroidia bacterium]|nr:hypothetical protein [Bacteroidia bacterium]
MAKAHGPILLSGKLQNLIFRVRDNKNIVHLAPDRIQVKNATQRYHDNRMEFGGAAKMAGQIYAGLQASGPDDPLGPIFRAYPQNLLTSRIRRAPNRNKVHIVGEQLPYVDKFQFCDIAPALKGLDLSGPEAPSAKVHITPMGPQHNPTAIKITGLQNAANAIPVHGNARLEFRLHIRQTEIKDIFFNAILKQWQRQDVKTRNSSSIQTKWSDPSDWIPIEFFPKEGITLPIPAVDETRNHLTAIFIEWREIRKVGRRMIQHHKHGIVRIAALHAPREAYRHSERSEESVSHSTSHCHQGHATHHAVPNPKTLSDGRMRHQDPKQFLQAALAKLFPKKEAPPLRKQ